MNTKCSPQQLAVDLLRRSVCTIQCAAVVVDSKGVIFGWGWNSSGADGLGEHAEAATIRRSNKRRLKGASIYVAGRRTRNGKIVSALPCQECRGLIVSSGIANVFYRVPGGFWPGFRSRIWGVNIG